MEVLGYIVIVGLVLVAGYLLLGKSEEKVEKTVSKVKGKK